MIGPKRTAHHRAAAAGGDVSGQADDNAFAARDRPSLRRARPYHDHARRRKIEELKLTDSQLADDVELCAVFWKAEIWVPIGHLDGSCQRKFPKNLEPGKLARFRVPRGTPA
jgi:hypothetical protein